MAFHHFEELAESLKGMPKKHVVVASPHDAHTLEALRMALENGIITYTLCGVKERMAIAAKEAGWPKPETLVGDPAHPSCAAIHYVEDDKEAAELSVRLIDEGKGDFILKGSLSTEIILRAVLHSEEAKFGVANLSHVSLVEIPTYPKLFGITDGGMVPHPTLEEKEMILRNALDLFRAMGYEKPVASLLCATERISHRMIETSDAETIAARALSGHYGKCVVDGPMAFDLAFSEECASIKHYESPVTGNFDILLTPDINSGNILTKALVHCVPGGRMAGCLVGARMPVALTSRGAKSEEKYLSLILALAAAHR